MSKVNMLRIQPDFEAITEFKELIEVLKIYQLEALVPEQGFNSLGKVKGLFRVLRSEQHDVPQQNPNAAIPEAKMDEAEVVPLHSEEV